MTINRRTITKLPLFAALAGVTGLAAAKSPELSEVLDDSVLSPTARIDRARVFLDFTKQQLPRRVVDSSNGDTVLSQEDMEEIAE